MADDFEFGPAPPGKDSDSDFADTFEYPVAFRFSFIGVGQAGGRIANTFRNIGYQRVCAVNTADADLAELPLAAEAKLTVGTSQGAGKDPDAAAAMFAAADEDIFDLLKRNWGDNTDYGFVCLSGAGGTGAGAFPKVAEVVKRFMKSAGKPRRVGCIMALPKNVDGQRSAQNALRSVNALQSLNLSPILFIDNERFVELYGSTITARDEKPKSNETTARLLHMVNRLSGTASEDLGGTTFDPTDFSRVLDSGVLAMAAADLRQWNSSADITTAVRDQLKANVLASVDLTLGTVAGLLYVIGGAAWDGQNAVKVTDIDYGTDMLNRMLSGQNASVFQGVYPREGATFLKILAIVGGLPLPKLRLKALREKAGKDPRVDEVARHLGIE